MLVCGLSTAACGMNHLENIPYSITTWMNKAADEVQIHLSKYF
jgi:hypothetical protein